MLHSDPEKPHIGDYTGQKKRGVPYKNNKVPNIPIIASCCCNIDDKGHTCG